MSLNVKRLIIAILGISFLISLIFVQWMETARRAEEAGLAPARIAIPASSKACVECHGQSTPAILEHWKGSTHAKKGVGCVECHTADKGDADGFDHYGYHIATVVTPRDCSRCHPKEFAEFEASHHAKAGNILASLDNTAAEVVEGSRVNFDPHSPTPGKGAPMPVNGMAFANTGCQQCHGSKMALVATEGSRSRRRT